jgi:Zn-finger nucleic acid-binding protein
MNCPACQTDSLAPCTDAEIGLEIDACPTCGGLWFDAHELGRFLDSAPMRKTFSWDLAPPRNEGDFTINTRARRCPRCAVEMEDRLFGGVTLDRCPSCKGLWFDGGELGVVVRRYKKGAHGDRAVARELRSALGDPTVGSDAQARTAEVLDRVRDFLGSLGVSE